MILCFLVFHGWLRWFVRLVGIAHGWWWLLPSSPLEDRDPLVFHVFLTQYFGQRIRHEGDPSSGNGWWGRSQLTCSRQLQFRTRFERLDHVGWSPGAISVMLVCDRQYVVNEQGVRMCPGPAWFLG